MLVGQDSGALKREYTSQFRENLMIEALSQVQSMDPKTFKQSVCSQLYIIYNCIMFTELDNVTLPPKHL